LELAHQNAGNILSYYDKVPGPIDEMARQIGYRVRPSFIWTFKRDGVNGLVIGLVNDGIAPVPGVLRLSVYSEDNKINVSGCVDAGYPKPTGVHQAMLMLPAGAQWEGLRLKAELEVKGFALSGPLGMPAEAQFRWLINTAPQLQP